MTAWLAICLLFQLWADEPVVTRWTINNVERTAIVVAPSKPTDNPPLIFAFHGHGGTARNSARTMALHQHWPEAVVIYPQGLNTPGKTDPDGKKPGWQKTAGDQMDRDLALFDEMLKWSGEKYKIDPQRVYATGHSNGGAFSYLLWETRHEKLAALAPSAAGGRVRELKPLPVMHLAGKKDQVVPFAMQELVMQVVRKVNGCEAAGKAWATDCTLYESPTKTPVVTLIHDGAHNYPAAAPALIVKFFQEHRRADAADKAAKP